MTGNRIKNIWLLLLYASKLYEHVRRQGQDLEEVEENPDRIPGLVAEILVDAVTRRLRRDLSLRYRTRHEVLNRMRGSIDLLYTERKMLLKQGNIACTFDELTVDTPPNRFVRAVLGKLANAVLQSPTSDAEHRGRLATKCRATATGLARAGVGYDAAPTPCRTGDVLSFGRLDRLSAMDREMLVAAELACTMELPVADQRIYEGYLPDLFEKAVAGFCKFHADRLGWKSVRSQRRLDWQVSEPRSGQLSKDNGEDLMPKMIPDIVLTSTNHRVIVDTKYADMITTNPYGQDKFASGYIYQLYSYLRSQEKDDDPLSTRSSGMLLYAAHGGGTRDVSVNIQGHDVRFAAVDLDMDSERIRSFLHDILSESSW